MLFYYFYNNICKQFYKIYRDQTVFAIIFELSFFINNAFYLNKFFFKSVGIRGITNSKAFFDYNFFFLKIKFFNKILWKFLNLRVRSKTWKTLLFFFYSSVSSIVNRSIFLKFNLFITFDSFNTINYFEYNKFLLIKIKKQAVSFALLYFLIFLYKPYLANKFSLFVISSYKNLSFEIFNFLNLVKSKSKFVYGSYIII